MIKVTELRIGNFLSVDESNETVVIIETLDYHKAYISGGKEIHYLYKQLNPIPLTPEWLQRMGFKDEWLEFNEGCQLTIHKDGTAMVSGWDSATSGQSVEVPCKYVHQLQNLYFVLTGKELTIKEVV